MTNQTNPTQAQADQLKLGIAVSQTAYALNNGGGLRIGQPLVKIDDTSLAGVEGSRPLNIDITPGYVVRGLYKDTKTGLDVFTGASGRKSQVFQSSISSFFPASTGKFTWSKNSDAISIAYG